MMTSKKACLHTRRSFPVLFAKNGSGNVDSLSRRTLFLPLTLDCLERAAKMHKSDTHWAQQMNEILPDSIKAIMVRRWKGL